MLSGHLLLRQVVHLIAIEYLGHLIRGKFWQLSLLELAADARYFSISGSQLFFFQAIRVVTFGRIDHFSILLLLSIISQRLFLLLLSFGLLIEVLPNSSCLDGLFIQCLFWQPPRANDWIRVQLNELGWVKSGLKFWEAIFVDCKKVIVLL